MGFDIDLNKILNKLLGVLSVLLIISLIISAIVDLIKPPKYITYSEFLDYVNSNSIHKIVYSSNS